MELNPKQKVRDQYLRKTYGINYQDWLELSENGCWICGKKDGRLNVDHRHVVKYKKLSPKEKAKEVRGCLCFMCNVMISKLERRKIARFLLQRIVAYFNTFKIYGDV